MKTKCYSVRLESLTRVSDKAYKAVAFNGSTAIIPASQIFGHDYETVKSEAVWISAWILEKKELQYSSKKVAWFDSETGKRLPSFTIKKHKPEKVNPVDNNEIARLKSDPS